MNVRFFTFGRYHGKDNIPGSTHIRVNQLLKYWPEAGLYKYGENPDALIFQKVYVTPDYKFPLHFEGIKILDICDPDWLDDAAIVETCNAMDAVVTPTEAIASFIRQFHNNVVVIPDRFDLETIPEPKEHTNPAEYVAWFGYAHNSILLKPAMPVLEDLHLKLILVADDDPIPDKWGNRRREDFYTFVKYNESTIYQELQKADFVVLPEGARPIDIYKSNNKTIKANLAGLPVARNADDVHLYMDARERKKWLDSNYEIICKEYDVRKSVEQYKQLINQVSNR